MSYPLVCLGDVADFINGVAFKPEDWGTEGKPIIRIQNLNDPSKEYNFTQREVKDTNIARKGDLLVSWSASLGVYEWNGQEAYINQHIFKVVPNGERIDKTYLKRALELSIVEMENQVHGATMKHITRGKFLANKIPLPPLAEQRRIALILDQADVLRQKRKQAIEKLDQLLQATFIDIFGDPKINPYKFNIEKLSKFYIDSKNGTKCGPFGSALKRHEYVEDGIPVWSMDVITLSGEFIDNPSLWVTNEKFRELESYSVEQGDVIISRAGTVGKMGVVQSQYDKSLISTNLIRLRFGKKLLPEYFVALMTYCKHRLSRLQTGADGAFTHMNTGILDNLEFPYPPIEKQKQFVDFLHMVNNNKQILLESYKRMNDLFASIQNQAFCGTL